jgi:hypothetical protein
LERKLVEEEDAEVTARLSALVEQSLCDLPLDVIAKLRLGVLGSGCPIW